MSNCVNKQIVHFDFVSQSVLVSMQQVELNNRRLLLIELDISNKIFWDLNNSNILIFYTKKVV